MATPNPYYEGVKKSSIKDEVDSMLHTHYKKTTGKASGIDPDVFSAQLNRLPEEQKKTILLDTMVDAFSPFRQSPSKPRKTFFGKAIKNEHCDFANRLISEIERSRDRLSFEQWQLVFHLVINDHLMKTGSSGKFWSVCNRMVVSTTPRPSSTPEPRPDLSTLPEDVLVALARCGFKFPEQLLAERISPGAGEPKYAKYSMTDFARLKGYNTLLPILDGAALGAAASLHDDDSDKAPLLKK